MVILPSAVVILPSAVVNAVPKVSTSDAKPTTSPSNSAMSAACESTCSCIIFTELSTTGSTRFPSPAIASYTAFADGY